MGCSSGGCPSAAKCNRAAITPMTMTSSAASSSVSRSPPTGSKRIRLPAAGRKRRAGRDRRGERIGVGGSDDSASRIQLAARWSESYAPDPDSLGNALKRFRVAYEYLDAVIHGVEPPDLDREVAETPTAHAPVPAPA